MKRFHDTAEMIPIYHQMIGKKVLKKSKSNNKTAPKPFKSGLRVNTVKDVVFYPEIQHACFIFEEDNSYVRCYQVRLAE